MVEEAEDSVEAAVEAFVGVVEEEEDIEEDSVVADEADIIHTIRT